MSGDRYYSGFGGTASGEPQGHGNARSDHRDDRESFGRRDSNSGAYRPREDPASDERSRYQQPSFRDLFGSRGSRGRGRRRGRARYNARDIRSGPSGGYGGRREDTRPVWNQLHNDTAQRLEEESGRRGLGSESWVPSASDEWKDESRFDTQRTPTGNASGPIVRMPRRAPIDEHDENLTSRKKRKYVPGGRIGKYTKTQEFHTRSLCCDVCERYFFDENAKATHDRSKEHLDAQMKKRKAEEECDIPTEPKKEEMVSQKPGAWFVNQEDIAKFVKENGKKWTRSFKGWANRSIEEAKKAANAAKDRNIVTSVQREILYEFRYHTDNCTMMQEPWGRKPAATGVHYRQVQPSACKDKVFSEEEQRKMEEDRKRAMQAKPAVVDLTTEKPVPSSTVTHAEVQNYFVRGLPMELARPGEVRDASKAIGTKTRMEDNEEAQTLMEVVVEEGLHEPVDAEQDTCDTIRITWKLPRSARYLLSVCKCQDKERLARQLKRVFPPSREDPKADDGEEAGDALVGRYNHLRSKYERKEYDYISWRRDLDDIILSFTKRGTRIGSLKQCLHMHIDAAIDNKDWAGCITSCTGLVKFHNCYQSWEDGDGEYVGDWILAGLLKTANEAKRKRAPGAGFSRLFSMVTRVRELPYRALDDFMVDHAVQVLKSVVSNNYSKFGQLQGDQMVTFKTKGKFKNLMDEVGDVVRERAIVTMTMVSGLSEEGAGVYLIPLALDLGFVTRTLNWPGVNAEERLSEARSFVEGLPQEIHVDATFPECMMLKPSTKRAVIKDSNVVDVEPLVKITRNALGIA